MDAQQKLALIPSRTRPFIPKQITWPVEPAVQQDFSFPSNIIYYIAKNPSTSKQYLKLVQCCKYFFQEFPLLVVDYVNQNLLSFEWQHVQPDFNELSSKIWITKKVDYGERNEEPNLAANLCTHLFKSDITRLNLRSQKLMFDDFKFIATCVRKIDLYEVQLVCEDGSFATLDMILEALPNIEKVQCWCTPEIIGPSTFENIAKLTNLSNLHQLTICDIPEVKDVKDLLAIRKIHKDALIHFDFDDELEYEKLSEGFKEQLDGVIEFIIGAKITGFIVLYHGQDDEKRKIMYHLYFEKTWLASYHEETLGSSYGSPSAFSCFKTSVHDMNSYVSEELSENGLFFPSLRRILVQMKTCMPVIVFLQNTIFLLIYKGENIECNFVNICNQMFISFDEENPKFGQDAVDVFESQPTYVVYDLLDIISQAPESIVPKAEWGFTITKNDENPILLEFDHFDGTKRAASPTFLLAMILKEVINAIKKELSLKSRPRELLFSIIEVDNEEVVKAGIEDAVAQINAVVPNESKHIKCNFLKLD